VSELWVPDPVWAVISYLRASRGLAAGARGVWRLQGRRRAELIGTDPDLNCRPVLSIVVLMSRGSTARSGGDDIATRCCEATTDHSACFLSSGSGCEAHSGVSFRSLGCHCPHRLTRETDTSLVCCFHSQRSRSSPCNRSYSLSSHHRVTAGTASHYLPKT